MARDISVAAQMDRFPSRAQCQHPFLIAQDAELWVFGVGAS